MKILINGEKELSQNQILNINPNCPAGNFRIKYNPNDQVQLFKFIRVETLEVVKE